MLAGRVRDSLFLLAATAAAFAALDLIGYALFLMPLGHLTLGTECFAAPPSVEEHGWLAFLPAHLLLGPAFVSLAFRTARARLVRAASLAGSLLLFFGTLAWVHRQLFSLALETFGSALNPVGVGEPQAVIAEAVATGLLSVALFLDSEHALGRAVGLVILVAAAAAAWLSVELLRHTMDLYDQPILLGQRGVLLVGALGLVAVGVSRSASANWRSLAAASAAAVVALVGVVATRAHAWDREHPLARLDEWGYPSVAGVTPPSSTSRVCAETSAFRLAATPRGIERDGRVLAADEAMQRIREDSEFFDDLRAQGVETALPRLELISEADAPPPLELLRLAADAGLPTLIGQRTTVSEYSGARGWIVRTTRCAIPLRLGADGTPVRQFRTWAELARAAEAGDLVSVE